MAYRHCASDPSDIQGIFFSNHRLATLYPSIQDIAATMLHLMGVAPPDALDGKALQLGKAANR